MVAFLADPEYQSRAPFDASFADVRALVDRLDCPVVFAGI
jgi:hypothetical protein